MTFGKSLRTTILAPVVQVGKVTTAKDCEEGNRFLTNNNLAVTHEGTVLSIPQAIGGA